MAHPHLDESTAMTAITIASRAPSIHNSQPWRWRIAPHSIHLYADPTRRLPETDPDERDLLVSCGAALHHLRVALAALGWSSRVHRLPNPAEPNHLAAIETSPHTPIPADIQLSIAIQARRTDRRRYSSWRLPPGLLDTLVTVAGQHGGLLVPIRDPSHRHALITAIWQAAQQQTASDGYASELTLWTGRGFGAEDGVPAANTPARYASAKAPASQAMAASTAASTRADFRVAAWSIPIFAMPTHQTPANC